MKDFGFVGAIPLDVMVLCLRCGYAHKPQRHGEPLLLEVPKDQAWLVNRDGEVVATIIGLWTDAPPVDKP
jgi:hypothetical protein